MDLAQGIKPALLVVGPCLQFRRHSHITTRVCQPQMAARMIARLTLFSGPQCSLCEVGIVQHCIYICLVTSANVQIAKVELAKVQKQVRNLLIFIQHSKLIESAQREFDLEVINIQGKGQERWKKKYVYWIPALHLDGKEIAKGRWDASTVLEALEQREAKLRESEQSME